MSVRLEISDYERILKKYRNLRFPPLTWPKSCPEGLLNPQLIAAYQKLFTLRDRQALGILVPDSDASSIEEKWENGDYELNQGSAKIWSKFCKLIRNNPEGDKACKDCYIKIAKLMEKRRKAIAYICCHGLIDFAIPVFCNGEIIAALFTGQFIPKAGKIWHPDFIEPEGIFRPLEESASDRGVDALAKCLDIIKDFRSRYVDPEEKELDLSGFIENEIKSESRRVLDPSNVQEFIEILEETGEQFSQLAETAYFYEKSWLRQRLRSNTDSLIRPLLNDTFQESEFRIGLRDNIKDLCLYMGFEVLALIEHNEHENTIELTVHYGLDSVIKQTTSVRECSPAQIQKVIDACPKAGGFVKTDISNLSDIPIFDLIPFLSSKKWDFKLFSFRHTVYNHTLMLYGKQGSLTGMKDSDVEDLLSLLFHIGQAVSSLRMVDALKQASLNEMLLLEEVAHDLRSPIQNIILKTQIIRRDMSLPKSVREDIRKISAQVYRLHMLSNRTWTIAQIKGENYKPVHGKVDVGQIIKECIKFLEDRAKIKNVAIEVDKPFKEYPEKLFYSDWPAIEVDHSLMLQAFLNLLDNAIKYSFYGKSVKLGGRLEGEYFIVTVGNVGIPITEKDKEKIWRKGFRSVDAKMHSQEGAGLGLDIVKTFAKHYGKIDVSSEPIGGGNYLNIFKVFIKPGGIGNEQLNNKG